jgi:hypothetical protein
MTAGAPSAFWEVTPQRIDEFLAAGHRRRHFFPHRVHHLPKCGPDGFQLAARMCQIDDPEAMWEIVLYAHPAAMAEFPEQLFFDDDLIWHRQQFGRPGQVATASLVVDGDTVYSVTHVSDLVQRISRRREHKTRVDKVFRGWNHMLLNAVMSFAQDRAATHVCLASSKLAVLHTDRSRQVDPALFERVYDQAVNALFPARRSGDWWAVDLAQARTRIVKPRRRTQKRRPRKTVCICHDVERGLGHLDSDTGFARRADRTSPDHLDAIREVEADLGVRTTYCVVGSLLNELQDGLAAEGHCLAFHSFDHRLDRDDQLARCRQVDYRLKGYRPPRSVITPELSDDNLLWRNFEWLASSPRSLGAAEPQMRRGLVRLPIAFDDFPLHTGAMRYDQWEPTMLASAAGSDFLAIGLHDCYASHWLAGYRRFLEQLREMAELRTLDEVAAEVTLASGV